MFERNKIEQLIATAAYEPLGAADQAWLDKKLTKYPEYRDMADDFRDLAEALPKEPPLFTADLLPVIRQELQDAPRRRRRQWAALSAGFAASMVVAAGGIVTAYSLRGMPTTAEPGGIEVQASAMGEAIKRAQALTEVGDFSAVQVLREAIAEQPDDALAGQAQLMLADLEFNHGERYAEAYDAYTRLKNNYGEIWTAQPQSAERFALLADVRKEDFQPMYELERARRDGAFGDLENLVARYPNRELAFAAMDAMREAAGGLESSGSAFRVAALETVRAQCTNPIALAQIDVKLGDLYWKELNNPDRALDLFCGVDKDAPVQLAQVAADAVSMLGACPNPAP